MESDMVTLDLKSVALKTKIHTNEEVFAKVRELKQKLEKKKQKVKELR